MPADETCSVLDDGQRCGAPVSVVMPGCGCGDPECAGDILLCERHGRQIGLIQE